jgi:hypothetical protein
VSQVEAAEVRRRTLEFFSDVAQEFKAINDDMEEPAPGQRQVRDALKELVDSGDAAKEGEREERRSLQWRLPEEEEP